jgi:hypothetical protein
VCGLALSKEIEDEEDGILPGGFAPCVLGSDKSRETIYVKKLKG